MSDDTEDPSVQDYLDNLEKTTATNYAVQPGAINIRPLGRAPELPAPDAMGALAAQDTYKPLGNDPWTNTMRGTPPEVVPPEAPSPVLYRTASPLVNITERDLDNATQIAMAASGGGLATKAPGSIIGSGGLANKGGAYTKEAQKALAEIAAGPKGAGPMDLSMSAVTPGVPQVAMDRWVPPRGVSARLADALTNPQVARGVGESIDRGVGMGADKWYHNEPVRQAFLNALGDEAGPRAYTKFMDHVAATSPRSDVPTNIRNASYQYMNALAGKDLPAELPYPYGHVAQNLHRQNFEMLTAPQPASLSAAAAPAHGFGNWDIYQNPKPASFSQNLQGNLEPGTMDTHAFRNIGIRSEDPRFLETSLSAKYKQGTDPGKDTIVARYGERTAPDKVVFRPQQLHKSGQLKLEDAKKIPYFWAAQPNANEYAAAEQFYKKLGQERGLPTADAQAAAWAGGGDVTGLGTSAVHTFPEMLNERVLFTSKMRGENPHQTLNDFIWGKKPLLSIGGAGAMGALAAQDNYSPSTEEY